MTLFTSQDMVFSFSSPRWISSPPTESTHWKTIHRNMVFHENFNDFYKVSEFRGNSNELESGEGWSPKHPMEPMAWVVHAEIFSPSHFCDRRRWKKVAWSFSWMNSVPIVWTNVVFYTFWSRSITSRPKNMFSVSQTKKKITSINNYYSTTRLRIAFFLLRRLMVVHLVNLFLQSIEHLRRMRKKFIGNYKCGLNVANPFKLAFFSISSSLGDSKWA